MKKIIILTAIALSILGASSWFIWNTKKNQITITGVIRTSGLLEDEKQRFELDSADYQITDFGDYANDYEEKEVSGYYLLSNNIDESLSGKCVKVTGFIPEKWKDKNTIRDAYNLSAIENVKIKITDSTNCNPYGETTTFDAEDEKKITLQGTVIRNTRPAPDIGYDYVLRLKEPIFDEYNFNGENFPAKRGLIDIAPTNNGHWLFLESNINKEVVIEGYLVWGYAESRYFQITEAQETIIKNLVIEFEKYVQTKDVGKLMSSFTLPKTKQEIESYQNLMGKNPDVGAPRLFNNVSSNFIITDWKIARREYPENEELITKVGDEYLVTVEETRKGWCNAEPCAGGYSFENTDFYILEIVNVNSKWLVNKYYFQNQNNTRTDTPKYEALGF